jgi:hypothetical protein
LLIVVNLLVKKEWGELSAFPGLQTYPPY